MLAVLHGMGEQTMPQIWMTYDELASLLECDGQDVRETVLRNEWHRRRSGDGLTRVKLPPDAASRYIESELMRRLGEAAIPIILDDGIERLRRTGARMRRVDSAARHAGTAG